MLRSLQGASCSVPNFSFPPKITEKKRSRGKSDRMSTPSCYFLSSPLAPRRSLFCYPRPMSTPSYALAIDGSDEAVSVEEAAETTASKMLRMVRVSALLVAILNATIVLSGLVIVNSIAASCSRAAKTPFVAACLLAAVKLLLMLAIARSQRYTAEAIVDSHALDNSIAFDAVLRHEIRVRYRRWLWWTRFGMAITMLQFMAAVHLMIVVLTAISRGGRSRACFLGQDEIKQGWRRSLAVSFLLFAWLAVLVQWFTGSDILKWRSFYSSHDAAWKAYYREVFDYGIREALCCLGRSKYLSVLEEDEVYSVARLLGDLVAYRASGTGHLELLAGLALLQKHSTLVNLQQNDLLEAPKQLIEEAAFLHPFCEAAYTGLLLDVGRNPILFPCTWAHRQGILTPWTRNSRPALEGDNWWRGHAAAYLSFANITANSLLRGRVCQTKREAAYFVVVLHDQKTLVISVRGTESPEDLITDGLCRECTLTSEDLNGLMNSGKLSEDTRQSVISTSPHYGHGGIVESARELLMQLDCPSEKESSGTSGFLSSLLGQGCKCYGYKVRIVGHSLGGAVATLLGVMLYGRYQDLHVYSFGGLPCLDPVLADACSDFVTTIILNDEFSSRLSINSMLRLRSAAISALSDNTPANSALLQRLAQRILQVNKFQLGGTSTDLNVRAYRPDTCVVDSRGIQASPSHLEEDNWSNGEALNFQGGSFGQPAEIVGTDHLTANCGISGREVPVEPPEIFVAGSIVHIQRQQRGILPFWSCWSAPEKTHLYKAFVSKKENFEDITVSPYMFIDHLPWRCRYSLQRVLEDQNIPEQGNADLSNLGHWA